MAEGHSAEDLKDLGASVGDLYGAGFTMLELYEEADFSRRDFYDAGLMEEVEWHERGGSCWWWWFPLVFLAPWGPNEP